MKKIFAIAAILFALGTEIVFADDSTCETVTKTIGTAVGCYAGGLQGCVVGNVVGTAIGNAVCPSSSSSGSTTDDYRGFEPIPGWED